MREGMRPPGSGFDAEVTNGRMPHQHRQATHSLWKHEKRKVHTLPWRRYIRPEQNLNPMPQDSGARLKSKRKATLKLLKRKAAGKTGGGNAKRKAAKKKA